MVPITKPPLPPATINLPTTFRTREVPRRLPEALRRIAARLKPHNAPCESAPIQAHDHGGQLATQIRRWLQTNEDKPFRVARPERLELPTYWFEVGSLYAPGRFVLFTGASFQLLTKGLSFTLFMEVYPGCLSALLS